MKNFRNKAFAMVLSLAMVVSMVAPATQAQATEGLQEYEIYPVPQQMEYAEGTWELSKQAEVVFESGIDEVTKARLEETLDLQGMKIAGGETEVGIERLFGSGRYETGYAVANELKAVLGVDKFEAVVVATGKNFADALAGSYLAVEKNAPILLTNGKDDNIAELHAYIAANVAEGGKIYILGGEAAVPAAVEAIEGYEVVRLFGDSRYDTNLAILGEAGVAGDSIIVATGKTFADSLSASAAKLPILLVKPNAALNDAQKEILAGMKNIYIVGGEGAVSAAYAEELAAYGEVTRVYGDSRYDTSVEIAKTFCADAEKAVVASGKNFPDGLCGGPLAAALGAPLVLTKDGGAAAAAAYVAENGITSGYVLGGEGALADETVAEVFGIDNSEEAAMEAETGNTKILVGIKGSGEAADQYVAENYEFATGDLFDKIDSYFLASDNGTIVVLGKDTNAAFYGLTSLYHIFGQVENKAIRNLEMEDWANTSIRGFIEGYYGVPWSNEDRMSLMDFGGDFKMTSYIFAPKDDLYHAGSKWRELYPEEDIAAIAEMVELGNRAKCRFVWTIHPFMNRDFNGNNVAGEIEVILNKFEQLYGVGVRQFGVLADDVGSLPRNTIIQLVNAISEWAEEKGDVYDTLFCPVGYNHSWQGNYSELNDYDAGFPDNVQIFWTGEAVCQPVEQRTLDHFRDYNAVNGERRAPLFWLNWPVNDINHSRMLMGKGSLLRTDINVDDLVGVVTNPMQEAEASKVAIFAVADYTWNVKAFNADQSWADSFAYIEADASEELHTLAKHMSNPQPNGHGLVLAESEELQPLINKFKTALANGADLTEVGAELIAEMDVIIDACDGFNEKSKNENLKDELAPFIASLKDLVTSIKKYTEAAMALQADKDVEAFDAYMAAVASYESSKSHTKPTLSVPEIVDPGSTYLIPLAETIAEAIGDEIQAYVFGDAETPVVLTGSSSFDAFYAGNIANIVDGDSNTYAWYGAGDAAGQYYQVNLSKPSTVYGIEVENGSTSEKADDTFGRAKLQYTTNGSTWVDVPNGATTTFCQPKLVVENLELENVTAVRYTCTQASGKWPSMREFSLVLEKSESGKAYTNVEAYDELTTAVGTDVHTFPATADVTLNAGEYLGLKLDRIHELAAVDVAVSEEGLTLQVSENSVEWTDVKAGAVDANARYIRLINKTDAAKTFDITKFEVSTVEVEDKAVENTNYSSFEGEISALFDNDWTTACQFANSQIAGKYITIDLGSTITLNSFKAVCTDSEWDFPRAGKFSVSADGEAWKEIMLLGNQNEPNPGESNTSDEIGFVLPDHEISYNTKSVTDLNEDVRYLKFEITRTKVGQDKWVRFQEFEINGGMYIPTVNDPTIEAGEEAADNQKGYMTDKTLSTMYTWIGDVIYHESDEERVDSMKIIQNGESGATLSVRYAGETSFEKVGELEGSISEFTFEKDVVAIKISTEKDTPCSIIEILTFSSAK